MSEEIWLWGFQKSYYALSWTKGLQNCDLSKLEVWKKSVFWVRRYISLSKFNFFTRNLKTFLLSTLTGHNFAASCTMITNSSFFEISKLYLFGQNWLFGWMQNLKFKHRTNSIIKSLTVIVASSTLFKLPTIAKIKQFIKKV